MKFFSGLLCALFLTVAALTAESQAQVYTVCNYSPTIVTVCMEADCGGLIVTLAPCPIFIWPGQCYSWPMLAGCVPAYVNVNGTSIALQPPGICTPLPPPHPPNVICFTGVGADIY